VIREALPDYRPTIKDLPLLSRPRERLDTLGSQGLSDAELLAIVLVTGSRQETALDLANRLLNQFNGLVGLMDLNLEELTMVKGIGVAKACQVKASLELAKRLQAWRGDVMPIIKCPGDVAGLLMEERRFLDREHFDILCLDTKSHVLKIENISIGSLNASIVHPREVFKKAIRCSAAAILLVHNHPSGDPTPSKEDIDVTKRLCESGELLGIKVLDHVIIGNKRFASLKEKGLM